MMKCRAASIYAAHFERTANQNRTATADTELMGQQIKAGDKIAISWLDNRGDKRTDEATVS